MRSPIEPQSLTVKSTVQNLGQHSVPISTQSSVHPTVQTTVPDQDRNPHKIAKEIYNISKDLLHIYKTEPLYHYPIDLLQYSHFCEIFYKMMLDIAEDPLRHIKIQQNFINEYSKFFFNTYNHFWGLSPQSSKHSQSSQSDKLGKFNHDKFKSEPKGDRRFADPIWDKDPNYQTLKKVYYLITEHALRWLNSLSTIDKKTRQQLHFYVKNFLDFLCPTNFISTNPEVIQKILESGGENILNGLKNYLQDLVHNKGRLNISKTDLKAFKVGKNIAMTPGKVIYQNDLMQLIQYSPQTEEVYQTPILFIPPWINKYYVLDLSPENSLVKWLVAQGFTVYMISWVNPSERLSSKEFSDYMLEGPIQALDIITETARCPSVHMVGYCIGGTLMACTLAYMAKTLDNRAKTSTYFMSLLDFSNPGELGVFIDKAQLKMLDKIMCEKGYLDGRLLDMTFNILRPNDLIWPYFINNYLLGKTVKPFDLLYWNADSSNLPFRMYSYYLRNMYLHNRLRKPNKLILSGVPLDLGKINVPSLFLASETDHITLWRSVYAGTKLLGGPVEYILTGSGHVRGVINPPAQKKYSYFVNHHYSQLMSDQVNRINHKNQQIHENNIHDGNHLNHNNKKLPHKVSDWKHSATEYAGSWWPYWVRWLTAADNVKVPARHPEKENIPIIEDAPGSYVLKRL